MSYKSMSIVEYRTPAGTDGLGTYWGLLKDDRPIDGVAILVGKATSDLVLLAVRLSAEFADTVSAIVHRVELDTKRDPN